MIYFVPSIACSVALATCMEVVRLNIAFGGLVVMLSTTPSFTTLRFLFMNFGFSLLEEEEDPCFVIFVYTKVSFLDHKCLYSHSLLNHIVKGQRTLQLDLIPKVGH